MKNFRIFLFSLIGFAFIFIASAFIFSKAEAQTATSTAATDPNSTDAIAVRIMPNPSHYSIARWYESQGFSGAPQALTVDGYEAVRDGRTVYVNATNVDGKNIYTNVYLISYNQSSADKTIDILGQIINHWKFNSNIIESSNPLPNCAISNKSCSSASDCGTDEVCSNSGISSSSCILKEVKNCLIDTDCPANFFCNSLKAKIIRDVKRVGQLGELKEALNKYKGLNDGHFPILASGTYLANHSVSLWPSWTQNLLANLPGSSSFLDPINRLGACPGYDTKTCWNNGLSKFIYNPTASYLMLPAGSYAFVYKTDVLGSNYNLCATLETRDSNIDYHFAPNDPSASACLINTGVTSGGSTLNTPPVLVDTALSGAAGQEFNGSIKVVDNENNPLTWSLDTSATDWSSWKNNNVSGAAPILKDSGSSNQKKVYASLAGDPGNYPISFKVDDGQGGILSTTTLIKIINNAPLIEASDGEYILSSYNPFSYSFVFSDNSLVDPTTAYSITQLSGVFDILGEAKNLTFSSVGINKYQVTRSAYLSPAAHQLANDLDFTYRITVTDKYKAVATKDIKIKLIVERPTIKINCPYKVRLGQNYSCFLGSSTSATRNNLKYFATAPFSDYLEITKSTSSDYSITGWAANRTGVFSNDIYVSDEYSAFATSSFSIQVNNFCGDGKIQKPNDEKQGGYYNDGYEDCDGAAGLATSVASSSATLRYGCTTKNSYVPDVITSNDYCTYSSAYDGGGYCDDSVCSPVNDSGNPENSCNCPQDCGQPADPSVCSGGGGTTAACTYTYSDWGACQADNTQSRIVTATSPSGCTGTPVTTQACTYEPLISCHLQSDCPSGYTCKSANVDSTTYYCTGWEGSHSCYSVNNKYGDGSCNDIPDSSPNFKNCQTACNSLKGVTINNVPNAGYCTWSVQSGICYNNNSCTYTYSDWSACQSDGTQSRTVDTAMPSGCIGTPMISKGCRVPGSF